MKISLGGLSWWLDCDDVVRPAVAKAFGKSEAGARDCEHEQARETVHVRMRMGDSQEIEHWTEFRSSHSMDMDSGILRFKVSDGRSARLSCVSLEIDAGEALEWVWLAAPSEILTRGGSLLLNAWMRRWNKDWFPVHGAVIGQNGRYVLIPGESGAGKSTLTASAFAAGSMPDANPHGAEANGWEIIGDDFVWVRRIDDEWMAEGPYASLRLTAEAREMVGRVWPEWSPESHWTQRGDGKWVGFPPKGVATRGKLHGVLGIVPSDSNADIHGQATASDLIPAFRTSMLLLNASGAHASGYLSACRQLLEELPLGRLHRSPRLDENLQAIARWLD